MTSVAIADLELLIDDDRDDLQRQYLFSRFGPGSSGGGPRKRDDRDSPRGRSIDHCASSLGSGSGELDLALVLGP